MQTGIANPVPIIAPVQKPNGEADLLRIWKDLTDYVNLLNTALQTIVPIRTVGVSYTVQLTDRVINVDCTAGDVVISLPSPGAFPTNLSVFGDFVFEIKRIDNSGNMVTVLPPEGRLIDTFASLTLLAYACVRIRPYMPYKGNQYTEYGVYS